MPQPVQIPLEPMTAARYFAPRAVEMARLGTSMKAIAEALGTTREVIREALRSIEIQAALSGENTLAVERIEAGTGRAPTWSTGKRPVKGGKPPKYIEHAAEVVRLHDVEGLSFERIGKQLGISPTTATTAYDHHLPDAVRAAAVSGTKPKRGIRVGIPMAKRREVLALLVAQRPDCEITQETGVSASTVGRLRRARASAA